MFCCAFPFCIAGCILMVFFATTITPSLSDRYGGWALLLIPLSALLGVYLGLEMMFLFFSLI